MLGPYGNRHLDADIAVEPVEDAHQPVHSEAVELDLADAREIGRSDAGAGLGIANGQLFLVERLSDTMILQKFSMPDSAWKT